MLDAILKSVLSWLASYIELWYSREKAIADETKIESIKFMVAEDKKVEVIEAKIKGSIDTVQPIVSVEDWNAGL